MYYRPKEKKRSPLVTALLLILLLVMSGILAGLWAIYIGYFKVKVPTLAERLAPPPTATLPAANYIIEGDEYFSEGKINQAIAAYEQAIQIEPDNYIPYIRQSRLLVYSRNTAKSLERAAQAVVLEPNNAENLAFYCRALDWEAQYAAAFDVCSCAIEIDPNYAEGYAFMSEIYSDLGNAIDAQESAEQALAVNYQNMHAHHNMGYALHVAGKEEEAIEYYENAIQLAPNLAPLYVDVGRIYHLLGEYEDAAKRFKQAIKLHPFDPEAYDLLGWTYYYSGEYVRAIDALEQSIGLDPNYVNPYRRESAWGHLGVVYYTRQNFEEATDYLQKAVELGEKEFLRRIRQIEIYTEVETLTGPKSIPVLRGRFTDWTNLNYTAHLKRVNYTAEQDFETEQSCGDLIKQDIETETILLGATQSLTITQPFQNATGTATLDLNEELLFVDIENLPPLESNFYEIRVHFWPNRTDTIAQFQSDEAQTFQANIQFEEKIEAPIEFYYQLGLAYTYLTPPVCDKALPWLLKALEIDRSPYNPAWYGLRTCPSVNAPPTPIPTFTPIPTSSP